MNHASISEFVDKVETWDPRKQGVESRFHYIDIGSVSQAAKVIQDPPVIIGEEAPSRARQIVRGGDILVSTVRPNLNAVALVPDELDGSTASTGFSILRPDDARLDRNYLFHWVRTQAFVSEMMRQATGQSYPAVSDKIVKASQIPLPPLEEQRRIARILDQADALRRLRSRALDKLNSLGQAIFHDMFGGLQSIERSLLEVADLKRGPFGGALKKEIFVAEGYQVYEQSHAISKNAHGGRYFIDERKFKEMRAFEVVPDDIIVSCSGTIGRVLRIPSDAPRGIINQALLRIRPNDTVIRPAFLEAFLETHHMRNFLSGFSRGTGLQNFPPMAEVKGILVPTPDLALQDQLIERLNHVVLRRQSMIDDDDLLRNLFSSLQHRAFRGEL